MCASADVGLIGLAVMGQNLVLNMESKGFTVAVYNRTTSKVDTFLQVFVLSQAILLTVERMKQKVKKLLAVTLWKN